MRRDLQDASAKTKSLPLEGFLRCVPPKNAWLTGEPLAGKKRLKA